MKQLTIYHEDNEYPYDLIVPGKAATEYLASGSLPKKCPPYLIAGELGWDILMPETFTVEWDGGKGRNSVKVSKPENPENMFFVNCFANNGQIAIKIPYLFQVEKDNFLWLKGPTNNPISTSLYPIDGLVEYDWFPAHAAMHYIITTPNKPIVLKKGQPYCRIVPYPKNYIEAFLPKYTDMNENPSFVKRLMRFIRVDKMMHRSPRHLKNYSYGFDGEKDVPHVESIKLSKPEGNISKCPFHKLFKK
jgi:hypothetical protein